jgi:hypothetical protein
MSEISVAPSPTAVATILIEPARTSPLANTPGTPVPTEAVFRSVQRNRRVGPYVPRYMRLRAA